MFSTFSKRCKPEALPFEPACLEPEEKMLITGCSGNFILDGSKQMAAHVRTDE
jgi:hypothetical protein